MAATQDDIAIRVHSRRGSNLIHPVSLESPPPSSAAASASPVVYREVKHFKKWFPWLIPLFVAANVVVFVVTMYVNDCPKNSISCVAGSLGRLSFQPFKENPLLGPSSTALEKMGALDVGKVVHKHEGWRLITCMWLHGGVLHLLANMLSLLIIGIRLEREFGFGRIGFLYLVSGFGGSLLSALFIQSNISVGASGALFGLLGGMLSELITNWSIYANKVAALLTLVVIIAINLAVGILPHVDNFAHIGGFLSGFLLGFVFLMRPQFGWVSQRYNPAAYPSSSASPKFKAYQRREAMAIRVMNGRTLFRCCTMSPPLPAVRCCQRRHKFARCRSPDRLFISRRIQCRLASYGYGLVPVRQYSAQSLVDMVIGQLESLRKRGRVRASNKYVKVLRLHSSRLELKINEEILESKVGKLALKKGLLLEFRKDPERLLLAVVEKPDGKKNWIVTDQNGNMASIKPQQITFIVPGVENFDQTEISTFVQKAQDNLDLALLEFAWVELLEKNKSTTVEELAEMIFGSTEPFESYCAHLLLTKDEVYFTTLETKGSYSVYGPRSAAQVEELTKRKRAKEVAEKEFEELVNILKSARDMPLHAKPPKSTWTSDEKVRKTIESLQAYAIDDCRNEDQKKTAGLILRAMGLAKTASAAVTLLINIGYFPVHINLDLLKLNIRTGFPEEINAAAEKLLSESPDMDEVDRTDLTHLKVYAIDVDEADERCFWQILKRRHVQLDDALSAVRLQDGRIKVWIHVADPTRLLQPGCMIDKEAMKRGTSVFLPTATYPMFPERLAMEGMSLKQGEFCKAVSVSVVLHSDGCIAEYSVENSLIRPTYMLTYESATELLYLNLEEEAELRLLSEAAALRLQWRQEQGAIDTSTIEARIKITNPDEPEPSIKLYVENQADPAMRLVSEMMILCGEVMATFGSANNIPLPYRGQPQSNIDTSAFSHLPEGPVRSFAIVRIMRAAEMDFRNPIRHGILGLPGYVQFTSPIRRYLDLLAHYQVKAFLRGDSLPFSAGRLEGIASLVNVNTRVIKRLSSTSLRYWIIEYLRQQPKHKTFSALVLRFIKDRVAAILLMEVITYKSGYKLLCGYLAV
ncbi:ribonuclease II/R family protein [Striga asiatica]|uniref:RHOMBOID-like protein n=1 Tax=Striga asiatica TaxID=4170 RepID=A0A5A7RDF7_STRAF|nr:ribonuclease II/R family protein [Striga asiatica]